MANTVDSPASNHDATAYVLAFAAFALFPLVDHFDVLQLVSGSKHCRVAPTLVIALSPETGCRHR